ncbi:concanavalin A-like lectin/glucanase domain-containing protein [Geopyxis carbonaria]|nr:concanavalin A-like lectin/glucanase domain-containing protein [Geopyxis carbonaria]
MYFRHGLSSLSFCLCLSLLLPFATPRTCPCGYLILNSTTHTPNPALTSPFTDLLETNFQLQPNIDYSPWSVQYHRNPYNPTGPNQDGRLGKSAQRSTVRNNPLSNASSLTAPTFAGDAGLELWVPGGPVPGDHVIPMAEIASARTDIRYGSFRAALRLSRVNGTCGAFFWYRSDTDEIDIEFLSKDTAPAAHLSLHSARLQPGGADADPDEEWDPASGTPTLHHVAALPFRPDSGWHEYRFDWTPERVSFFADGRWLHDVARGIPDKPGPLFLNHWSDGRPVWTGGPPEMDAVMTVRYVKAYFNSSHAARGREFERVCREAGEGRLPCGVPDQVGPPGEGTYWVGEGEREPSGAGRGGVSWPIVVAALGMAVGLALV